MKLRARQFRFDFPRPTLVMGIVNVTPDSFSDGGLWLDENAAVAHGLDLVREGADILDVGGESTRPGATPVSEVEELRRVVPVIRRLSREVAVPISIDTRKPAVALAAVEAGASIINDIEANRDDLDMAQVVGTSRAGYICMHMQGTPGTMQSAPTYRDVIAEVAAFFEERLSRLTSAGVDLDQIALDVGIGFGKTDEHNLRLLAALEHFTRHGRPLLLGVSRKSFIGRLLGTGVSDRLPGTLACTTWAVQAGVQIVRTHDVRPTRETIRMTESIRAHRERWT